MTEWSRHFNIDKTTQLTALYFNHILKMRSKCLLFFTHRYAKNLRLYFQEYARSVCERRDHNGEASERTVYQNIIAGSTGSEKNLKPEAEIDDNNVNENEHDVGNSKGGGKGGTDCSENGTDKHEDLLSYLEKDSEGEYQHTTGPHREKSKHDTSKDSGDMRVINKQDGVETSSSPIDPTRKGVSVPANFRKLWKHFEPFFDWLDDVDCLPEVLYYIILLDFNPY